MKKKIFKMFLKIFRKEITGLVERGISHFYYRTLDDSVIISKDRLEAKESNLADDVNHYIFLGL